MLYTNATIITMNQRREILAGAIPNDTGVGVDGIGPEWPQL